MMFKALGSGDIDLILDIQKGNFPDGWNRDMLISAFNSDGFYAFCLQDEGNTVGLITYSTSVDSADIEGVVVVNSQRKKGYGKRLVEHVLALLRAQGVNKVFLEVRETNLPAIALYTACGFNKISVRRKYYSDGENALVMQKEI